MTTETGEPTLTIDELAARTGVTVRTIRFYSTRGLLPPPAIGPRRVGHYGPAHLSRLALIEDLQHQGLTLAAIERYLERLPADLSDQDLALHRALVAAWVPDAAEETSRAELERRAGRPLTGQDVARLTAMGALAATAEPDAFLVDPAMLRLGLQLLDVPISHEAILAARAILMEHARSAAAELSRLFKDEVWENAGAAGDPGEVERIKSLSAHMQPLVVQALVATFQRSLRDELRSWLPAGADKE
ncbi:MerR family transcriptional regulator [Streptomyces albidoflavus]|jgi:DNA-binding transcriptional MerR regulator|uniref:MerR family DNA-binding transcriptional regulator n=2 Tax=Streptomyces TaxID=1883 RepID=A0AB37XL35_9ACTN|nr:MULTISPECIES: MerR family transcriptional regulator [Streptomyces]MBO1282853.1 MerR family transcriptional regulator [Streptomyces sampsonii]MYW62265.1 MerR family transcriptional regulator [Streptomyces sp. SID8370]MYW85765.1 MerR family transcriptional regulator [Streptomyces sp. SID8371]MYX87927.1 MerR family transcriptional regulator [Streptomyces sp. SID4915]NVI31003.1 MerR family transcriptional regulator [Streptomyces sp. CAI-17]QLA55497.1 MerR family transcriptional regulator [Stre